MPKIKLISLIFFLLCFAFIFLKFFKTEKTSDREIKNQDFKSYNSNIVSEVEYISEDIKGNIYRINALTGEVDLKNSNILFLTNVVALIELKNSDKITIKSDFGKYNISNNDTIFSKNVSVRYLDNLITAEYLDFSMVKNSLIISKNVIYKSLNKILYADNLDMNIETKDTKINMYEKNKKIKILNK